MARAYEPRPTARAGRREWPAFRFFGVLGFVAACCVAGGLAGAGGLSLEVQAGLILAAVGTFYVLAVVTKLASGRERLVYYHHEIAVLCVTGGVAAALGAPVLAHLDATALGLGAFLALGRVGCLRVGCCHGRPAGRGGVRYGDRHAQLGLPRHLAGVPLVPVQAIESAAVAALVAGGAGAVLAGAAPGSGLLVYVTGYALLRFGLEMLRGDESRRSAAGLTEAQWTSLLLLGAMAAAGAAGALPGGGAELLAGAAGLAALLPRAASLARRGGSAARAREVREIAQCLERAVAHSHSPPAVSRTAAGLSISWGETAGVVHYTLSGREPDALAATAETVRRLRHPGEPADVVAGPAGATHLVVMTG